MTDTILPGFEARTLDVEETSVFCRVRGDGPPLLLLHGFPQTHAMWHRVAPALAERHTVVCADLRGYGASGKPASTPDHAPYAKRAMARDLVQAMAALGFAHFALAGHDRGGRVAYRLALDRPDCVARLALLDLVPTADAWQRADARFALDFWPWSLLAQPAPLPERLLLADPEAIVDDALGGWGSQASSFPPALRAHYIDALRDAGSAHAICEEYRAAATLDAAHDRADRDAGRRIACPTLVLWSRDSALDRWYADEGGPLGLWRAWAPQVQGHAVDGGHFFAEQNPGATVDALSAFFAE
jgi:haloacetate dehalogenase